MAWRRQVPGSGGAAREDLSFRRLSRGRFRWLRGRYELLPGTDGRVPHHLHRPLRQGEPEGPRLLPVSLPQG